MAWLSTITAAGTITQSKKYLTNSLWVILGGSQHYKQSRVVTITRYPGLTQAAAETKAAADSATENITDAHTENTGGGSFAAVSTLDVVGDWEPVE